MATKKKTRAKRPQTRKSAARKAPARKAKAKKVDPIPKGMHTLTPSLSFKDAQAALKFYKEAFGGKELYRLCEPGGKIGHAEMMIGDSVIMMGEEYPSMSIYGAEHYGGSPVRLNIAVKDVDRAFKRAVDAGAEVARPVEDQFYGWRSGIVKDPFGYSWYISSQIEELSPKQMQKRWDKMMASAPQQTG
jgi:PhnB protein